MSLAKVKTRIDLEFIYRETYPINKLIMGKLSPLASFTAPRQTCERDRFYPSGRGGHKKSGRDSISPRFLGREEKTYPSRLPPTEESLLPLFAAA